MHLIRNFDPPSCRFLPSVPWPRFSSIPKFPCTSFFLKVSVFIALCFEFLIRLNRAPGSVETWCVCLCVLRSVVRGAAPAGCQPSRGATCPRATFFRRSLNRPPSPTSFACVLRWVRLCLRNYCFNPFFNLEVFPRKDLFPLVESCNHR